MMTFSSIRVFSIPHLAILLCGALLLAGCATVQTDYDPHVNLHNFHTYRLEYTGNTDAVAFNNPLNAKRLRDAVEAQLASRGMQSVAEGQVPDCVVHVSTGSRQVVDNAPSPRIGIGWGWYGHGIGGSMAWENDVYAYDEHRIAVDLLDGKTGEPVWHASINANINQGSGITAEARIKDVVAKIFAKYP